MSLVYGWKYLKAKMEFKFASIEKNLIKFIQEFANCQNKPALVAVVKTLTFATDLNLFTNNICTILTMKKTKYYGKFI